MEITDSRVKLADSAVICKVTDVSFNPLQFQVQLNVAGIVDSRQVEFVMMLKNAAESMVIKELLPQSTVFVALQVLSSGGSLFSACCNAIYTAFLRHGIPVKQCAFATLCYKDQQDADVIINPDRKQMQTADKIVEMACINDQYHCLYSSSSTIASDGALKAYCQTFRSKLESLLHGHDTDKASLNAN